MSIKTQSDEKKKIQAVQYICNGLADLVEEFKIDPNEIIEGIKIARVNKHHKKNPFISQQELSWKSGVDRRYVKSYIGKEIEMETNKYRMLLQVLRGYFVRKDIKTLPLKEGIPSFRSIVNKIFNQSESYISIAQEMIESKMFTLDVVDGVELLTYNNRGIIYKTKNPQIFLECIANTVNDTIKTVLHNFNNDDKLYQQRLMSTQIHPMDYDITKSEVRVILQEALSNLKTCLNSHEDLDVEPGTYDEIGINLAMFQKQSINK